MLCMHRNKIGRPSVKLEEAVGAWFAGGPLHMLCDGPLGGTSRFVLLSNAALGCRPHL